MVGRPGVPCGRGIHLGPSVDVAQALVPALLVRGLEHIIIKVVGYQLILATVGQTGRGHQTDPATIGVQEHILPR